MRKPRAKVKKNPHPARQEWVVWGFAGVVGIPRLFLYDTAHEARHWAHHYGVVSRRFVVHLAPPHPQRRGAP